MEHFLHSITIQGFKSIESIQDLDLRRINILIGANGSGKSNFLAVFDFLRKLTEGRLQEQVLAAGGADAFLHFGVTRNPSVFFKLWFEAQASGYEIRLDGSEGDVLFPQRERAYYWDHAMYPDRPYDEPIAKAGLEAGISSEQPTRTKKRVRENLSRWRTYHFHDTSPSSPLRRISQVDDNRFLRSDGGNLAAFLYLLSRKYISEFQVITSSVQRVAPFFKGFALEPDRLNTEVVKLEWLHEGTDQHFGATRLSDGTLRFIALATLFLQPPELRPPLIIIDEPELGLHPTAISLLAGMIRSAASSSQVIVSTQSPQLIDNFEPEDILVAERVTGATQLTRKDTNSLSIWLEDYSLGELWEKNYLGGRP